MQHLRSTSLAGLSSVTMIFDDEQRRTTGIAKKCRRAPVPGHPAQPASSRRSAPTGVPSARSSGTPSAAPTRSTTPWPSRALRTGRSKKAVPLRARRSRCVELRRPYARVPGHPRPQQAHRLRPHRRPGKAAALPPTTPTPAGPLLSRASSRSTFARSASSPPSATLSRHRPQSRRTARPCKRLGRRDRSVEGPKIRLGSGRQDLSAASTASSTIRRPTWSKASFCCKREKTPTRSSRAFTPR